MARYYVLNSAVITAPGTYRYRLVSAEEAREWYHRHKPESTIGYQQTADALGAIVGDTIAVNRTTITMEPGDAALVFRIVLPPGSPRIQPGDKGAIEQVLLEKHYEIGILERVD